MTAVVVPWRPTPDRQRVWDMLRLSWDGLGYRVIEGGCPDGPWRKAVAVADAMSKVDSGVVVIADADVWCDGIGEAVARVAAGVSWAVPHYLVKRWNWTGHELAERPYAGRAGGGMVVLSRETYERCPMDPRFAGWGQEDEAWGLALRTLLGQVWRGTADLHHHWHQPADRTDRGTGSPDNLALYRRYAGAFQKPQAMTALLDEARRWPNG